MMADDTASHESPADGAKLLVRILVRRRRPTSETDLRRIFEREGSAAVEFTPAIEMRCFTVGLPAVRTAF